ncbi:hypothetical protein [Enterococcus avium]|uniref:hypothetical protein n=1 Tax=Enterococcus avium TaxID=33945 RepID=UPI0037BD2E6B
MSNDKQLFLCGICGKMTPLVMKKEHLNGGVQHYYAECQLCKGKTTHSFTNQHIRSMLAKQKRTLPGIKKEKLARRIINEMNELRDKYE